MQEDNQKFEYSYSAPSERERREVERMRREYLGESKESDIQALRNLDKKVHTFPMVLSLSIGVIGTLVFGLGLTLILEWGKWTFGIIFGAIGAIVASLAYPAYSFTYNKNKKKYGKQILELADKFLEKE